MAQTVCVIVNDSDRAHLEAIASDRNRLQKHAERASVVLASIPGDPVQRVAARLGISRPMVWYGNNALPKLAWMACCVTRRANPASRRSLPNHARQLIEHLKTSGNEVSRAQ